ncbi:helix-turn-helix domain-containing protein [Pseudomonas corrugata]|uniref:helix-turn-helix domain-containing protein n=1 Tax=Pseudomonas corrugata TaxID=47879 RepID=UPI0018E5AFD4|nr:helix-turn-helix domain-containing protein [Pseudomonas corrugata]MBI6694204.1 helix-turn-helix domain-containing protein [Pseudomonas corrugata]
MPNNGNAPDRDQYRTSTELRLLREKVDLTQEEAAEFLYVSVKKYRNWEYGVTLLPRAIYEFFEIKARYAGRL